MPAGTVVASGSLVSPGGQQGPSGQNLVSQGFVSQTAAYTLTTADNGKYFICRPDQCYKMLYAKQY